MRAIPRFCLPVLFVPLAACAATIPSAATFEPSAWQAVEALRPGTRVDVAYVAGSPRLLHYSFTGEIESVDAARLVLRTKEGPQRLLAERVLRVSRLTRTGNRSRAGAIWGAAVGGLLGSIFAFESHQRSQQMTLCAMIGAGAGAALGALKQGEVKTRVYQRR